MPHIPSTATRSKIVVRQGPAELAPCDDCLPFLFFLILMAGLPIDANRRNASKKRAEIAETSTKKPDGQAKQGQEK